MSPKILKPRPTLEKEIELLKAGYQYIAGVDEVGGGAIAGPLIVAAIILPLPPFNTPDFEQKLAEVATELLPVLDSKRVEDGRLEKLYKLLLSLSPIYYSTSQVGIEELHEIRNLNLAALIATRRAVETLPIPADYILFDNGLAPSEVDFTIPHISLAKGDEVSLSIACASILAKYTHDSIMREYSQKYPGYGFDAHKGYGTPQHQAALDELGPSPIHYTFHKRVRKAADNFIKGIK